MDIYYSKETNIQKITISTMCEHLVVWIICELYNHFAMQKTYGRNSNSGTYVYVLGSLTPHTHTCTPTHTLFSSFLKVGHGSLYLDHSCPAWKHSRPWVTTLTRVRLSPQTPRHSTFTTQTKVSMNGRRASKQTASHQKDYNNMYRHNTWTRSQTVFMLFHIQCVKYMITVCETMCRCVLTWEVI